MIMLDKSAPTPHEGVGLSDDRVKEIFLEGADPTEEEARKIAYVTLMGIMSKLPDSEKFRLATILEAITGLEFNTPLDLATYLERAVTKDDEFIELVRKLAIVTVPEIEEEHNNEDESKGAESS